MKFNIIGAGRLGKNIALALDSARLGQLETVCNKSLSSAKQAVNELGFGRAIDNLSGLAPAEFNFISCSDDAIAQVAAELSQQGKQLKGSIIVHCSGVLASTELNPLKQQGCLIASLHPLKAFRAGQLDKDSFRACICVMEGDEPALTKLSELFSALGARLISIKAENKACYHAAAVFASNYLVTLAAIASDLWVDAGIPAPTARQMGLELMASSFNNLQQSQSIKEALTGPLSRGDLKTIEKHLQALADPSVKNLYQAAALATLPLTSLDNKTQRELDILLME